MEFRGRRWHSETIVYGGQWHHVALNFEDEAPELLGQMKSGQRSCTSSGCHEFIHDVGSLKDMKFWSGVPVGLKEAVQP